MAKARVHVLISGRVQGVSFRYFTLQEAQRLDVYGWVRNLWDGRVEAVFEGEQAAVDELLAWCRRGPSAALVDEVQVTAGEPNSEFTNFRIRINASVRE